MGVDPPASVRPVGQRVRAALGHACARIVVVDEEDLRVVARRVDVQRLDARVLPFCQHSLRRERTHAYAEAPPEWQQHQPYCRHNSTSAAALRVLFSDLCSGRRIQKLCAASTERTSRADRLQTAARRLKT